MLGLLLIAVVAVLFPPSSAESAGLTSSLVDVGAISPPQFLDLLPHNLMVLALNASIPVMAVVGARAAGRPRVRLAGGGAGWSGHERTLMWRVLPAAAAASVAYQLGSLGRTLGGLARGWQVSPVALIEHLVHGPLELSALCLPLAALLVCAGERRREHLPRVLLAALGVAALLLVAAGVVGSQLTPGLVSHLVMFGPVVK